MSQPQKLAGVPEGVPRSLWAEGLLPSRQQTLTDAQGAKCLTRGSQLTAWVLKFGVYLVPSPSCSVLPRFPFFTRNPLDSEWELSASLFCVQPT